MDGAGQREIAAIRGRHCSDERAAAYFAGLRYHLHSSF